MALHEDILSRPTSMALHKDILSRLKCMALHRDIFSVGSRVWPYIKIFFEFFGVHTTFFQNAIHFKIIFWAYISDICGREQFFKVGLNYTE